MQQHKQANQGHQSAKKPTPAVAGKRPLSSDAGDRILTLQRAAGNRAVNGLLGNGPPSNGGQSLDPGVQTFMEERFGADFSAVRVHADGQADSATREIGATAFTDGQEIHFAAGQYQPDTAPGRQLLAHELAHVVQTNGQPASGPRIAPGRESWEGQAQQAATSIHGDAPIQVMTGAPAAIRLARSPHLAAVLTRIESLPVNSTMDDLLWIVAEGNVDVSDRDNLNPIITAIANRLPQDVMFQFLNYVEQSIPGKQRQPTAAEVAQHQRNIRIMQVGRRGPYGTYGPGVAFPVIAGVAKPLLDLLRALENAFKSAGAFVSGICEGVSQSISEDQARQLADRLLGSAILNMVFPPVFLSGALVGIVEDVVDAIKGIYHIATNLRELASAAIEMMGVFFSDEGPRIAKQFGIAVGGSMAAQILNLLKGNIFRFTFNLGRLIGPTIIYTILAFLGIPGLLAASIAGRIFTVLRPLLSRFPKLLKLLRSLTDRLTPRRGRGSGDADPPARPPAKETPPRQLDEPRRQPTETPDQPPARATGEGGSGDVPVRQDQPPVPETRRPPQQTDAPPGGTRDTPPTPPRDAPGGLPGATGTRHLPREFRMPNHSKSGFPTTSQQLGTAEQRAARRVRKRGERVGAGEQGTKSTDIPGGRTGPRDHWHEHGQEFPEFRNARQYERGAIDFCQAPTTRRFYYKSSGGRPTIGYYDVKSKGFAATSVDGEKIFTYFRPDDVETYVRNIRNPPTIRRRQPPTNPRHGTPTRRR